MSRKRLSLPDLQVIIPYRDLVELLGAAYEVDTLRSEVKQTRQQLSALRLMFSDLMEKLSDSDD